LPIIIVGAGCFRQFRVGRGGRTGLLAVNPDGKMDRYRGGAGAVYPADGDEFDTVCYRTSWSASKTHFDHKGKSTGGWVENPQRFLLFGRPQIGKTGAFLHLVYLLWDKIDADAIYLGYPVVDVEYLSDGDEDEGDHDQDQDQDVAEVQALDDKAFSDHPRVSYIQHHTRWVGRKSLKPGKYGSPRSDVLWKHYVEEKQSSIHPEAYKESTAGKRRDPSTSSNRPPVAGGGAAATTEAPPPALQSTSRFVRVRFPSKPFSNLGKQPCTRRDVTGLLDSAMFGDGDKLTLSIPESENAMWSGVDGITELKHVPLSDVNDVKFLIFQPSAGRARHALLDLSDAMAPDGRYTQVVVVKQTDEAEYRQCWPDRTLLVLPGSADALGVGASRYWIQHFSSAVMDPEFPFIFVLDDSVLYWKRTLHSLRP
jgi:hypothetical protein